MGQSSANGDSELADLCDSDYAVLVSAYILLQHRNKLLGRDTAWVAYIGVGSSKNKEHFLLHGHTCADQFARGCISTLRQVVLSAFSRTARTSHEEKSVFRLRYYKPHVL